MTKEQEEMVQEKGWDLDAVEAYLELGKGDDDLSDFEESYQGKWQSDEDFVQNLLEETDLLPNNLPAYIYIDWGRTAHDVMMDYSEEGGHYFRDF